MVARVPDLPFCKVLGHLVQSFLRFPRTPDRQAEPPPFCNIIDLWAETCGQQIVRYIIIMLQKCLMKVK